jgi:sodium-dependent dicarboxylate transporter 2/3/5
MKSNIIILIIAAVLLLAAIFLPGYAALTKSMVSTMCLIIMAVMLWVFHPIPIGITSLFVVSLMPLLGLTKTLNDAFEGYSNPANYFVIASFGFGLALIKTNFSQNILNHLLKLCNGDANKITLVFMILIYMLSTVMSDITAVIIGVGFAMELINLINDTAQKNTFGRQVLLGIPISSLLGGTATPVGSTINIMALNILKNYSGIDVTFIQWMILGMPVSIVMLFISWFLLIMFYPTKNLDHMLLANFANKTKLKMTDLKNEKIILAVLAAIIVAWVASSWVPVLNTTIVAIIGLAILMMPGIEAFTWKEFRDAMPWELPLMGGATIALGSVSVNTKLITLIIDTVTDGFSSINAFVLISVVAALVSLLLMAIPVGPAMVSMLTIPAYLMAEKFSKTPVMIVIIVAMFASNSSLLPLNAVFLIPYTKGFFTISELARVGICMTVFWILIAAIWFSLSTPWVF